MILVGCCLCSRPLFAEDSDTTYGRIRIKDKAPSSHDDSNDKRHSSHGHGRSSDEAEDESFFSSCTHSCVSGMMDGCLDAVFNNEDTKAVDDGSPAYNPSPETERTDNREVRGERGFYSYSPFHVAGGLVAGANFYTGDIASGTVVGGDLGFSYFFHPLLGLRLSTDVAGSFDKLNVDMEKDVFVRDTLVGTSVFSGDRGYEFILPIKVELLFVPPTVSRMFFFSLGGGVSYKRETVFGKQTFDNSTEDRKVSFNQGCPNIHVGIGILIPYSYSFGILEVGYSLFVNANQRRFETPGDNSPYGHLIHFSYSFSSP